MLKLVFSFLFLINILPNQIYSSESSKQIQYSFSFKETSKNKLLVECTFQGNHSGITELILPHEWANQLELERNISELNCNEYNIENTDQNYIKLIHHKSDDIITISYVVQLLSKNLGYENYFIVF